MGSSFLIADCSSFSEYGTRTPIPPWQETDKGGKELFEEKALVIDEVEVLREWVLPTDVLAD